MGKKKFESVISLPARWEWDSGNSIVVLDDKDNRICELLNDRSSSEYEAGNQDISTKAALIVSTLNDPSFKKLREANVKRCEMAFHKVSAWSPTDWACAMAGEAGEACNKIKKLRRGQNISRKSIADELADVVIYTDLLAARLGIDLGEAVIRKFNAVSKKKRVGVRL